MIRPYVAFVPPQASAALRLMLARTLTPTHRKALP